MVLTVCPSRVNLVCVCTGVTFYTSHSITPSLYYTESMSLCMLLCSSTIYDNIEASLFVKLPFSWSSNDKDVNIFVKVVKLEHLAISIATHYRYMILLL